LYQIKGPGITENADATWLSSVPEAFELAAMNSLRLGLWTGNAPTMVGLILVLQLRVAAVHKVCITLVARCHFVNPTLCLADIWTHAEQDRAGEQFREEERCHQNRVQ
jgi:hypothetical protein